MSFLLRTEKMAREIRRRYPDLQVRAIAIRATIEVNGVPFTVEFLEDIGIERLEEIVEGYNVQRRD